MYIDSSRSALPSSYNFIYATIIFIIIICLLVTRDSSSFSCFLNKWTFVSNWNTILFYNIWNACSCDRLLMWMITKWHFELFLFICEFPTTRIVVSQMWIQCRIQIRPGLRIWPLDREIDDAVRRRQQSQGRYFRESLHQREWASSLNWPIDSASRLKTAADNHTLGQDYLLCRSRILSDFSCLSLFLCASSFYYHTIWSIW